MEYILSNKLKTIRIGSSPATTVSCMGKGFLVIPCPVKGELFRVILSGVCEKATNGIHVDYVRIKKSKAIPIISVPAIELKDIGIDIEIESGDVIQVKVHNYTCSSVQLTAIAVLDTRHIPILDCDYDEFEEAEQTHHRYQEMVRNGKGA